jgi:hypothetical protein
MFQNYAYYYHSFWNKVEQILNMKFIHSAMSRSIQRVVESIWKSEGRGARVRRSIGLREIGKIDPFLMLDEFTGSSLKGAGFPDHPHRGFETVTYVLEGEMYHKDFLGNSGTLKPGDMQWMTAGRGIIHSEIPGREMVRGLQLWLNLKSEYKMVQPTYQELSSNQVLTVEENGVVVKVLAGEALGKSSEVRTRTPAYYLDVTLHQSAKLKQSIPHKWTTFCYTLDGEVEIGPDCRKIPAHHTVVFNLDGDCVEFSNKSNEIARFVLISGEPIGEPVVQHGPFVMNTQEEIEQTIDDYRNHQNGFENAKNWKSEIGTKFIQGTLWN